MTCANRRIVVGRLTCIVERETRRDSEKERRLMKMVQSSVNKTSASIERPGFVHEEILFRKLCEKDAV